MKRANQDGDTSVLDRFARYQTWRARMLEQGHSENSLVEVQVLAESEGQKRTTPREQRSSYYVASLISGLRVKEAQIMSDLPKSKVFKSKESARAMNVCRGRPCATNFFR